MKLQRRLVTGFVVVIALGVLGVPRSSALDAEQHLTDTDRAAFGPTILPAAVYESLLDANLTWTDPSGNTRDKAEILQGLKAGRGLPFERDQSAEIPLTVHIYGRIGVVQANRGNLYVLRIWHRVWAVDSESWRLLIYQAVLTGAAASAEPRNTKCENPCNSVPFEPRNEDERDVIHAYQAVEQAVTAHDSAAWGAHIAGEFFAITSNSDRPLDKATRMAGLDRQREGGIAPFPLVSARMFQFGDAMVMISRQQPEQGLPLHVTRIWFKRGGVWLEAYSYQTTIQSGNPSR